MALHKSMLEEFGLGTVGVGRGTAAAETSAAVPGQPAAAGVPVAHVAERGPETSSAVKADSIDALTALDAALSAAQTSQGNVRQAPSRTPPADVDTSRIKADQFFPSAEPPVFDDLPWLDDVPPQAPAAPETIDDTAADIASLDWDTLAARVSVCERCRLCERRRNSVSGVGAGGVCWLA